ncbi:MAG: phosphoribosylanthranilate isomerase, partial [Planctomycetota bacterium]|nr:phosphoribosylanthranilate isomerase [Planctomycetota bacterium]
FVNSTDDEVCRTYDHLQLDLIQLHGNEPPEFLTSLGGRPVLRAFRLGSDGVRPVLSYLNECESLGCPPAGILIDAYQPGQYGGTGKTADWDRLADERTQFDDLPLILAGGLSADNVSEAIRKVKPDGVDTASGVEKTAGKKDAESVRSFVTAAFAAHREAG